jgi:hypothetical protein
VCFCFGLFLNASVSNIFVVLSMTLLLEVEIYYSPLPQKIVKCFQKVVRSLCFKAYIECMVYVSDHYQMVKM